jgi:hypothetical protein
MTPDERVREGFALFEQGRDYIFGASVRHSLTRRLRRLTSSFGAS